MCVRIVGVCVGLDIDVLSVSMRCRVIFCIYEHVKMYLSKIVRNFENMCSAIFVQTNGPPPIPSLA